VTDSLTRHKQHKQTTIMALMSVTTGLSSGSSQVYVMYFK